MRNVIKNSDTQQPSFGTQNIQGMYNIYKSLKKTWDFMLHTADHSWISFQHDMHYQMSD